MPTSTTVRYLRLLILLLRGSKESVTQIARHLEVTRRTIFRYKADLRLLADIYPDEFGFKPAAPDPIVAIPKAESPPPMTSREALVLR